MLGDLAQVYREILRDAVAPIYWFSEGTSTVAANGTMTFARAGDHVFGVTALHVLSGYLEAVGSHCYLWDQPFKFEVIDRSDELDLVTVRLPHHLLAQLGKVIQPVTLGGWQEPVEEGRGVLLCGYPGSERYESRTTGEHAVNWGLFTAIGVARRVTPSQITWKPDIDYHVPQMGIPLLPPNQNLGGISGGPLIGLFEKAGGHLSYQRLSGIIVQADAGLELVVARRTDSIRPDGSIGRLT